jgi:hypothetical protein
MTDSLEWGPDAVGHDHASGYGRATTSAWLGVLGLIGCLFAPWPAVLSVLAVVLALAAGRNWADTAALRLTGLITGVVGIALAAIWLAATAGHFAG